MAWRIAAAIALPAAVGSLGSDIVASSKSSSMSDQSVGGTSTNENGLAVLDSGDEPSRDGPGVRGGELRLAEAHSRCPLSVA
jgi:hypothetical protein